MRFRYVISAVAVASTVLAGSVQPAAARPAPAAADQVSSCASRPDSPDATPEARDGFVDLWLPRFKDHAWLTAYAERDTVPADIRAEGFHAMDEATQVWLTACLVDEMVRAAGESPGAEQRTDYLIGANLIIFGKSEITKLREGLTENEEPEPEAPAAGPGEVPVQQDQTMAALDQVSEDLLDEPSLTSADQPRTDATAPEPRVSKRVEAPASPRLRRFSGAGPAPTALDLPGSLLDVAPVPQLLAAIDSLLQLVSKIQGVLFTLPGLNILASAFYKICAESPTMPLKCSVSLPVGVPIPADVDGDNVPDVTGWLSPLANFRDVGAKFMVSRLAPWQGPLPAHVFAVYDTPVGDKRIQFGYDGRSSTLANRTATKFMLKKIRSAVTGDINVTADVLTYSPGASQSLTFAVKSLEGGSFWVPPTEEDPMTGSVRMSPVPDRLTMDARLIHTEARDQDIFTIGASTPTKVDAVIDQATTTTSPQSSRRFTAEVDKLPTSVTVDLVRNGEQQTIEYTGSAPIDHVKASDKAIPDVSKPDSFTESIYEVSGVPTSVKVDLLKAEDIQYAASSTIPEVAFQTRTLDAGVLQQQISAKAHQVPRSIHVTNLTTEEATTFSYDADTELADVELSMYDLNEDDETNLQAKASGIPTHLEFTQTKGTGVFDFATNDGIDLIEGSLSRNDGMLLAMPGKDHATVHKAGDAIGLDFRLSGFSSAHFDGSEDTFVSLGLSPGGQSFDAVADLDDPDVLAKVHVAELPTDMSVRVSPEGESATYTGSSVIPLIRASIEKRDTGDELGVEIEDVPSGIDLLFDADGSTIAWDASAATGKLSAIAHLTAATLGSDRDFDAGLRITSIPSEWEASWADGNVLFEAPAPGIGSIEATVTNHGANHLLPGDHLSAFYDEPSGDLDASLRVSNLRKAAFTKLAGADGGGFQADLKMGNHGTFGFAADVTLSSGERLDATGRFSDLPSDLTLRSEGGRITYAGDSNPTLTMAVTAGTSAAAVAATPAPTHVHGVSVRDGASGADRAVRANLHLTGLPDSLDLNSPAGTYQVGGYHPTEDTLVVDAVLTTLADQPLSLQVQQVVPTANPVDFTFGPFLTDTAGDGTHTLSLNYAASQTLGSLTANARYGNTDEAQLHISAIPSSISVNAGFGAAQKTVGISMSEGIDDLTAAYKKVGATDFAASVHLSDVPSAVNLQLGRATATGGGTEVSAPDFTFTASDDDMDIDAAVSAEIADPVDATAAATLQVVNMGSTVTGQLDGTTLKITSSPKTDEFLLSAAGGVDLTVGLDFEAGPLTNTGSLEVDLDINQLTLGFKDATSLQLDLGITTGLKGDYSTFTFGVDSDTEITIEDTLNLSIPTPFGDVDLNIIDIDPTTIDFNNIIDHFRLASNRLAEVWSQRVIDVGLGYCDFVIELRPHAEGSTSGSSFTVDQPPSDGSNPPAWLIMPDPNALGITVPDFIMDVVMYFTSPYGNDFDTDLDCEDRLPDL